MKANHLRLGNNVYYHVSDPTDTKNPETDYENVIDILDLSHIDRYPDDHNYRPIPLSEKVLEEHGWKFDGEWYNYREFGIDLRNKRLTQYVRRFYNQLPFPESLHRLQNIIFALTGEELP